MITGYTPKSSLSLPLEQLQSLQNLVEQQLDWINAGDLKKQMWRLLSLALSSEMADEMNYKERSDLVYMHQQLCTFFDELEKLRSFTR